ncbi:hypothetical protein ACFLQK_00950 [bacterium]
MSQRETSLKVLLLVIVFLLFQSITYYYNQKNPIRFYHYRKDNLDTARFLVEKGLKQRKFICIAMTPEKPDYNSYENICEAIHTTHFISYPLLLTPIVKYFKNDVLAATIFNIGIGLSVVLVFFSTVRKFYGLEIAFFSSLFLASMASFANISGVIYSQILEMLMLVIVVRALISVKKFLTLFLLFSAACLAGPVSMIVSALLITSMLLPYKSNPFSGENKLKILLLFIPVIAVGLTHLYLITSTCNETGIQSMYTSFLTRATTSEQTLHVEVLNFAKLNTVLTANPILAFGPIVFFLGLLFMYNYIVLKNRDTPVQMIMYLTVPLLLFLLVFFNAALLHTVVYSYILGFPLMAAIEFKRIQNAKIKYLFLAVHFAFTILRVFIT